MAPQSLQGKTALVTGAAKRIGLAIALALAEEGMNIVIHYHRSATEAQSLVAKLRERGVQAWLLQADFRDPAQSETVIERALELAGSLDLLVNSASDFGSESVPDLTFETLTESLAVNAWAPFALARDFCEKAGHGQVINLIDAGVDGYYFHHVAYTLAKTSLHKLTEMLALQYAPQVAVNAIMPGLILPPPGEAETFLDALSHTVPMGRHGDPDDIAAAAVFLAKSTFLTGSMLYVDGGGHLGGRRPGSSVPPR